MEENEELLKNIRSVN